MAAAAAACTGWRRGSHSCRNLLTNKNSPYAREMLEREARSLIKKYDAEGSGSLSVTQLAKLLGDRDSTTPQGSLPTTDEIQYVLWMADLNGDSCVDVVELQYALQTWQSYIQDRQRLQLHIQKFNRDGSGGLSCDELRQYLSFKRGGVVSEEEAKNVMNTADLSGDGLIQRAELALATEIWRSVGSRKSGTSQMCSIM